MASASEDEGSVEASPSYLRRLRTCRASQTTPPVGVYIHIPKERYGRVLTPKSTKVISNLRVKKAPGLDLITARMLKEAHKKLRIYLTYVFNAILRIRYISKQWKCAKVITVPIPGKPRPKIILADLASSYYLQSF